MLNMEVKNLIDYFVLCGLDVKSGLEAESTSPDEPTNTKSPLERSYKSKILYHFPENLPWNPFDEDAVTQLCLPKGLIFQKHSSKPTFHPFIITREDGSRVYGATLTFFELIEDQSICNAMQSLQTMYDAEHSSANRSLSSHTTPSSIRNHHRSSSSTQMELTNRSSQSSTQPIVPKSLFRTNCQNHNPTMDIENQTSLTQSNKESMRENLEPSTYDTVLKSSNGSYKTPRRSLTTKLSVSSPTKICHYNILKDRLYASKCICIISQSPLNKSFSKILQTLFDMVEKTDLLGINLECHLYNLIYEIPMPANGQAVKLQVGCRPIAAYMPDPISQLPILDFDLMDFFRLLGVTNIVNLYITGLLEHQILLYSKDYYLLMLVAESLTSLFFPFSWLKPYVPIVPASNLHFIEAPVPYIMGFHHKDIDKEFFKQGQRCFVDIDSGTVSCPEALPEFPQKNKLIKDINEIIVYFVDKKQKLKKQTSSANLDILHASQAYVRIAELAHKTGAFCDQNVSQDHTRSGSNGQKESWMDEEEVVGLQFNRCVRELFLQKFVQMFATYEKFVIVPNMENNDLENWWMNRDHAGNFDSKMFLIEQPSPRLPFLSHFLSTQMFVSFIDLKIVSLIDPQKPADANIRIFDEKIRAFKTHDINLYEVKSDHAKGLVDIKHLENEILNQLKKEPFQAPCVLSDRQNDTKHIESAFMAKFTLTATEQIQENTENVYLFENIDKNCLKADENLINQIYSEMIKKKELLMKNREQFKNSQIQLSLDKPSKQSKEKRRSRQKDKNDSPTTEHTESKIQELNPFIQSLLKESKLKTKRMLVEKMPEAATLGHGEARISGIEENMLIASLCDLIERIWGHGLHNKGGKSALWNHLSNYRKLIQYLHPNPLSNLDPINVSSRSTTLPRKRVTSALTPDPISQRTTPYMASLNRAYVKSTSNLASVPTGNHKRAVSSNGEPVISLSPLKNDLLADLARIDKLTEVKTEIGLARAFVRLSLEKKLLADHLRQLLSEAELLRALYKKHAFLRQEEEREQFIYHLQSLNVVDYFCFTNHFKSMPTDYLVMIVPSKKFNSSTTSANPYMKLFGSLAESDVTLIPKNSLELVISCKNNLGPLTSLVIGHDNAGITPKWMIECLFVRNEITGHIDRFPCGRWLGKGVDDDSLERLLIAEPLDFNETYDLTNLKVLSPFNPRSRSPTVIRSDEKKLPSSAIQEMIGDTINTLVKFFERPETERGHLTSLMCGESGLVTCLEHIFTFGFKSYKLFKKLYVWDFLEKAAYEIETLLNYPNIKSLGAKTSRNFYHEKFIAAIKAINSTSTNYGKDGKFQILICLACRDSFLTEWFMILSRTNTATQMYDEFSFIRNHDLNKFCYKILSITDQFNFKLENSLTMGIVY